MLLRARPPVWLETASKAVWPPLKLYAGRRKFQTLPRFSRLFPSDNWPSGIRTIERVFSDILSSCHSSRNYPEATRLCSSVTTLHTGREFLLWRKQSHRNKTRNLMTVTWWQWQYSDQWATVRHAPETPPLIWSGRGQQPASWGHRGDCGDSRGGGTQTGDNLLRAKSKIITTKCLKLFDGKSKHLSRNFSVWEGPRESTFLTSPEQWSYHVTTAPALRVGSCTKIVLKPGKRLFSTFWPAHERLRRKWEIGLRSKRFSICGSRDTASCLPTAAVGVKRELWEKTSTGSHLDHLPLETQVGDV